MRKVFSLFLFFVLWASISGAAVYYVGQNATGDGSGSSLENLMSVSVHNSRSFNPGDTIYLCGTINTTVTISSNGTASDYINYSGECYGNHGSINTTEDFAVTMTNVSYVSLSDLNATSEQDIIKVGGGSHYVTFDNLTMHDCYKRGLYITDDTEGNNRNSNIIVQNCEIYDVGCGTAGADIMMAYTDNFTVKNNKLFATKSDGLPTDRGIDGVVAVRSTNGIIEYNLIHDHNDDYYDDPLGESYGPREGRGEDGIDIKEWSSDIIIRYNHIYNHNHQSGITVQNGSKNVEIYGNYIHDNNWPNIFLKDSSSESDGISTENISIYSNVLKKASRRGIGIDSTNDGVRIVSIENNFFEENSLNASNSYDAAIYTARADNVTIVNNIFFNNRTAYGTHHAVSTATGMVGLKISHNLFWDGSGQSRVYLEGTFVGINSDPRLHDNIDVDPGLILLRTGSYALSTSSPCYRTGERTSHDIALGMVSIDWSIPNPVEVHRLGWDIGPWSINAPVVDVGHIAGAPKIIMK